MAELVVAQSEDLSAVLKRLLDLASEQGEDPRSIVWHPDNYSATVPDGVYRAYIGEVQAGDQPLAVEPYEDERVEELRKELGRRELSKTGLKDELITRLREDDAKGAVEPDVGDGTEPDDGEPDGSGEGGTEEEGGGGE